MWRVTFGYIYLCSAVDGEQRTRDAGRGAADVDDAAAPPVCHAGHDDPAHVQHGRDVAPDHVVEQPGSEPGRSRALVLFRGRVQEVLGVWVRQPDVVDEHAHLETVQFTGHVPVHCFWVGVRKVGAHAPDLSARMLGADLVRCRLQLGLCPTDQDHVQAAAGQLPGVRFAQSVRSAGHHYGQYASRANVCTHTHAYVQYNIIQYNIIKYNKIQYNINTVA